jgi:DNA mismatch repair protein MutS2
MIDPHTLDVLDYASVRSRVAAACHSPLGRFLAGGLSPSTDPQSVDDSLCLTAELLRLTSLGEAPDLSPLADMSPVLAVLARSGDTLTLPDLLTLRAQLRLARSVSSRVKALDTDDYPRTTGEFSAIRCPEGARDGVEGVLTEEGGIRDDASPGLLSVRERLRKTRENLSAVLDAIVGDPSLGTVLSDRVITQRDGRYVVPVKAGAADRVDGMVIDRSSRGGTFFVEPTAAAPLNARLGSLLREEEEEVRKVLREVTAALAPYAGVLAASQQTLSLLDLRLGMARVSGGWSGIRPESTDGEILLHKARHPGITEMVPLDLRLGRGHRILVLSGPNTGGKTVALKTLGLAVLLHQSGLLIPAAAGSRLPVLSGLLADIGDEQSIAQSLSTFSGHLVHLADFLGKAGGGDLLLIDELGAGTEPVEGAALGMAILEEFSRRGCLVLATTHHEALKEMALTTAGFENASMEFDTATAMPTYRLRYGLPGASQALAIARRYGIPASVVDAAADVVGRGWIEPARIMERLLAEEKRITERGAALAERETEAGRREERIVKEESRIAGAVAEESERARTTIRGLVREARDEVKRLRDALKAPRLTGPEVDRIAVESGRRLQGLAGEAATHVREEVAPSGGPPVLGDRVWLPGFKAWGEVIGIAAWPKEVEVAIRGVRFKLPGAGLDLLRTSPPERRGGIAVEVEEALSIRFDMRGMRVDEAIGEVDRFLDRALLTGHSVVELLHGKGTGALKAALREHLASHPGIVSFREAVREGGGAGVTLVVLRDDAEPKSR